MATTVFHELKTFTDWDNDYYHPIALRYYDRAVAQMLEVLRPAPGGLVLDAGCGPGVHSIRAARAGYQVHALDLSEVVLEEARRRAAEQGVLDRITFEQADLTSLRFDSESFETIFSWGVVIHIPRLDDAIRELVRILKPGGRLALQITNHQAWDIPVERLGRWLLRKPPLQLERHPLGLGRWYEANGSRLWVWRIDIPALTRMLDDLGCRLIRRRAAEFTEIQWRLRGWKRSALLRLNSLWFNMGLPARPACTNLVIFEKSR